MNDEISKHRRNLQLLISKCNEITTSISTLKIPGSVTWKSVSKSPLQCVLCIPEQQKSVSGEAKDKECPYARMVFDARIFSRNAEFLMLYRMGDSQTLNKELKVIIGCLDKELSDFKSERRLAHALEGHIPTKGDINSIVRQLDIILLDTREVLSLMHLVAPSDEEIDAGLDAEKVHGYVAAIRANPLEGYAARSLAKHVQNGF